MKDSASKGFKTRVLHLSSTFHTSQNALGHGRLRTLWSQYYGPVSYKTKILITLENKIVGKNPNACFQIDAVRSEYYWLILKKRRFDWPRQPISKHKF